MQTKLFAIYDSKIEAYGQPFSQKTHGEAERTFKQGVNDLNTNLGKFPQDFDLYYLGAYDDQTGKISAESTPTHVIKATALKD